MNDPPVILALETSTEACSVALGVGEREWLRHAVAPRQHAPNVLPWAEALLSEAGIERGDLDAVAFGRGPGSFTGVRLAASLAQGLAYSLDCPALPVSTLEALAWAASRDPMPGLGIVAALDARMGEVYVGTYGWAAGPVLTPIGNESVGPPEQVAPLPADRLWLAAGTGWAAHKTALTAAVGAPVRHSPVELPDAAATLALARAAWHARATVSAQAIRPVYLRDRVAEPRP